MRILKVVRYARFKIRRWLTIALRPLLIRLSLLEARRLALKRRPPAGKSALLLPTADPGNLGDEAFFWGAAQELREMGYQRVCVISFHREKMWKVPGAESFVMALHHNPAGGEYLRFVKFAGQFTHFYIWGADILDGSQGLNIAIPRLQLADLAARLGLHTTICSFSLNASPVPEMISGFQKLAPRVLLYCRDDISRQRLDERVDRGRAKLSADVAFLLKPDHSTLLARETAAWVANQKKAGKIVMGLNINDMLCYYFSQMTPNVLAECYAEAFVELRERFSNIAILHIPHNIHANPTPHQTDDFALAAAFDETLPDGLRKDCRMLPCSVRATEIRAACNYVDFVFSGRMHLTIAALSEGTPVFAVAYQGKFEGLFRHFELENMLVTEQQIRNPAAIADFVETGIHRLPEIREQILTRLAAVKDLARKNLSLR